MREPLQSISRVLIAWPLNSSPSNSFSLKYHQHTRSLQRHTSRQIDGIYLLPRSIPMLYIFNQRNEYEYSDYLRIPN